MEVANGFSCHGYSIYTVNTFVQKKYRCILLMQAITITANDLELIRTEPFLLLLWLLMISNLSNVSILERWTDQSWARRNVCIEIYHVLPGTVGGRVKLNWPEVWMSVWICVFPKLVSHPGYISVSPPVFSVFWSAMTLTRINQLPTMNEWINIASYAHGRWQEPWPPFRVGHCYHVFRRVAVVH